MYKLMESTPTRTRYRVLSSKDVDVLAAAIAGKRMASKVTVPVAEPVETPIVVQPTVEPEPAIEPEVVAPEPIEEPVAVEPEVTVPEPEESVEEVVEQEPEVPEAEEPAEDAEEPVKESTPLSVLGVSAAIKKNLKFNKITSVEDLSAFLASGATLESLPRIGAKVEAIVLEAFNKWQTNQKN